MQSKARSVAEYLASLPSDRRAAIEAVREVILRNLDPAYREVMQYGMIGYCVPHSVFPHGYHCDPKQPLPFAGLASQKGHMSLYLMGVYSDGQDAESQWFRKAWAKTGKRLDMGKACVRFKKLDDLALDIVGEAIRRMPVRKFIGTYLVSLAARGLGPDGKKLGAASARAGAKSAPKSRSPVGAAAKTRSATAKKTARKAAKKPARRSAAK